MKGHNRRSNGTRVREESQERTRTESNVIYIAFNDRADQQLMFTFVIDNL